MLKPRFKPGGCPVFDVCSDEAAVIVQSAGGR